MEKRKWIYQLRGVAILAVVVQHQQGLIHKTEWVQLMTLPCVTVFIFCAGLTQTISLAKRETHFDAEYHKISKYLCVKLCPILLEYIIASMACLSLTNSWTGLEFSILFNNLLEATAIGAFYFLKYYIILTIISPILYYLIKRILASNGKMNGLFLIVFWCTMFAIGYLSIGRLNSLGQSFLCVYAIGMSMGFIMLNNHLKNCTFAKKPSRCLVVGGGNRHPGILFNQAILLGKSFPTKLCL